MLGFLSEEHEEEQGKGCNQLVFDGFCEGLCIGSAGVSFKLVLQRLCKSHYNCSRLWGRL